ncbi:MAG TPA: bifunctional ornithine acetyltransferase/N-acetylglutamate synthase [Candidatus Thermoplasmatota archaeon]|nr:bifunctional ornithine acetyltransferase/N-acetylglutamate synthase [Candidatus Thermoplasmatota archaeon]
MAFVSQHGERILPGSVLDVKGYKGSGVHAAIKKKRRDLAVIFSTFPDTACAAVFTTNKVQAAPVMVSRVHAATGRARAIVVNSGCANAVTGPRGLLDAERTAELAAALLGVKKTEILVASTGVIGRFLPMDNLETGLRNAIGTLWNGGTSEDVAEAIMTTDLVPKNVLVETFIDGVPVRVGGVAKGSGMIHPNMATMLGFLTTDAAITPQALQAALRKVTDRTFNMITVDGDTSTNDMVTVLANGAAGNALLTEESPGYPAFVAALQVACEDLAKKIARDGEGANCLLEVRVKGAKTEADARLAARSVAKSSLVKSAVFGKDPNWGRILAAIGYSGADIDPTRINLTLGSASGLAKILMDGAPVDVDLEAVRRHLHKEHVIVIADLNVGDATATAWGCDLSYDYVKINAEYTT